MPQFDFIFIQAVLFYQGLLILFFRVKFLFGNSFQKF
jgi:hypothetical protein